MRTLGSVRAARAAAAAVLAFAAAAALNAAPSSLNFTGSAETLLSGGALDDEAGGGAFFGAEQYANLRLKARFGDRGTFYGALNLIAATGAPVAAGGDSLLSVGDNYAAALELERLYYRIESDAADVEAGLMRLPFGYGQAWSPSDFLSPRNPMLPDARTRGVLAAAASAYPDDRLKLKAFAVAPKDAESADGAGAVFGATADFHAERASVQVLYSAEALSEPIHRVGLSAKIEAGLGIALDALLTVGSADAANLDADAALDGLQASAGFDYSFFGGNLYVLAEYLWDGGSADNPGAFEGGNYLYGSIVYYFDDYTSATLDCAAALDDGSLAPGLTLGYEPFQGFSLSLSCRTPLGDGEYGPSAENPRLTVSATAKAKF